MLVVIMIVFNLAGCSKSNMLSFNVKKGDKYKITTITNQKITMKVMEQDMKMDQQMTMEYLYDITDVDKEGIATVRVKYDYIVMKSSVAGINIEIDTRKESSKSNIESKPYFALIGQGFAFKVDKHGVIKSIEGVDAMLDKVMEGLNTLEPAQKEAFVTMIKQNFGEEALKQALSQLTDIYPKKEVNVGETWKTEQKLTYGIPMVISTDWTLKEIQDGFASVDVKSHINANADGKPIDMMGLKVIYKITGDQTGNLKLNKENGLIQKGEYTQKLAGTTEMTMPAIDGQNQQNLTVPVNAENKIIIESKKEK